MAEPKTLISAQEFLRLSSASSQRLELVDGEVVARVTPGLRHGELAVYLSSLLLPHARRLLWLMEPESRTITIHRPDRSARVLTVDDMLAGDDVIPGFQVPVREVFEGV